MSASVFPARAGMSRGHYPPIPHLLSVPRASGDEPRAAAASTIKQACSPRERG